MIQRIVICFSSMLQMLYLYIIITHIFVILGVLLFFKISQEGPATQYYDIELDTLANFDSYLQGLFQLFLRVSENGWSEIIFDYSERVGSSLIPTLFFCSYFFIIQFVIISLFIGVSWEVFTIISKHDGQKKKKLKSYISHKMHKGEDIAEIDVDDHFDLINDIPNVRNIIFLLIMQQEFKIEFEFLNPQYIIGTHPLIKEFRYQVETIIHKTLQVLEKQDLEKKLNKKIENDKNDDNEDTVQFWLSKNDSSIHPKLPLYDSIKPFKFGNLKSNKTITARKREISCFENVSKTSFLYPLPSKII